jgi:ribosomal protein L37E
MIEMFKPTRTWDTLAHAHRNYQSVVCSVCGFTDNVPITKRVALAPEVILRQMQKKGWLMGHKRRHDVCPRCAKREAAERVFR